MTSAQSSELGTSCPVAHDMESTTKPAPIVIELFECQGAFSLASLSRGCRLQRTENWFESARAYVLSTLNFKRHIAKQPVLSRKDLYDTAILSAFLRNFKVGLYFVMWQMLCPGCRHQAHTTAHFVIAVDTKPATRYNRIGNFQLVGRGRILDCGTKRSNRGTHAGSQELTTYLGIESRHFCRTRYQGPYLGTLSAR